MRISVVLSTYPAHLHHFIRNLEELAAQSHREFELIVIHDGELPDNEIARLVMQGNAMLEDISIHVRAVPVGHSIGDNTRREGLEQAGGDYITWLNADNTVYDHWLACHVENATTQPGCISIVNTYSWQLFKPMPDRIKQYDIDLLNFALPLPVAREIDAFGDWIRENEHGCGDWLTLKRALALARVRWDKFQPVCGENR